MDHCIVCPYRHAMWVAVVVGQQSQDQEIAMPSSPSLRSAFSLTIALAALSMTAPQAGTVTVVTSFPKELTQACKAAFEKTTR